MSEPVATERCTSCTPPKPGRAASSEIPRYSGGSAADVIWLDGGAAHVGCNPSESVLPLDGEAPRRQVRLKPFGIEACTVTAARFAAFVEATGYVSEAEEIGWSFVFNDFMPDDFQRHAQRPAEAPWWMRVDGAFWGAPEGPGSDWRDRADHPAVHISWRDARAFAGWVGGRLPTEAEWEHAAHGGLKGIYPWGDSEPDDEGFTPCNIWQGTFPRHNTGRDGYLGTAPARSFGANGYGLYNAAGNVWEWCADPFRIRSLSALAKTRNAAARAQGQRVMKGGSYLCHRSYCHRYRIAARQGCPPDTATGHGGFRVAYDPGRRRSKARN